MVGPRTPRQIADATSIALYGWTASEARDAFQCIRCRKPVGDFEGWTELDRDEWRYLTALCPDCWSWITGEDA